ncbi:aldehyde dehydrogenase [Vallitalea sp. AN17-2]|uniref:Aldehyde dehydrogenase n=1 Tax=Vallitalea maricola TaxID=3074433 RepID=A0ACB5UMC6_9FIRM|nr:aldehyde dehydrogenase [Vallitalea sp. AN17-2]
MRELVEKQRKYFLTHETKDLAFRKKQLNLLREAIQKYETRLFDGLNKDFRKSNFETYETEIGMALEEIRYTIKHLKKWAKPKKRPTPLAHFKSTSRIYSEPYGVVLVMSPWNYPFLLTISPVIGAMAAGNCVVVKTSRYVPHTSSVIKEMIEQYFDPKYITVVEGGRDVNTALLAEKFDYIFFTGSPTVGKIVMEAGAKNLTPVTLELGGKSPCIVDETANIKIAAKRIIWGKLVNAGQTCVAPDYILAHKSVKNQLIEELKKVITSYYGENIYESPDFPRIVNEKHYNRVSGLINKDKVVFGGETVEKENYVSPTIMDNVTWDDDVMKEEIFGPLIPVLEFDKIKDVIALLNDKPKPLALYYFSTNKSNINEVLKKVSYGGGCVNDTLVHLANINMPFGGVGNSGMGGYHGIDSFRTFSHHKSVLTKAMWIDIPARYPPYNEKDLKTIRKLLK